jgi:nitroreductase
MNVSDAVAYRRSVRGFLDKPVDVDAVRGIVEQASWAASGGNLQPWHVDIVHGESMVRLKSIMATKMTLEAREAADYPVYPSPLAAPWRDRRFELGEMLYDAVGIERENKLGRALWFSRNFQFFDAPVGLFISLDRSMGPPQWADAGSLLATIMLLLVEAGLDSCPQECWAAFPRTIGDFLRLPDNRILWTGMAIGYKNPDDPANRLKPKRAPADEWLTLHG